MFWLFPGYDFNKIRFRKNQKIFGKFVFSLCRESSIRFLIRNLLLSGPRNRCWLASAPATNLGLTVPHPRAWLVERGAAQQTNVAGARSTKVAGGAPITRCVGPYKARFNGSPARLTARPGPKSEKWERGRNQGRRGGSQVRVRTSEPPGFRRFQI